MAIICLCTLVREAPVVWFLCYIELKVGCTLACTTDLPQKSVALLYIVQTNDGVTLEEATDIQ